MDEAHWLLHGGWSGGSPAGDTDGDAHFSDAGLLACAQYVGDILKGALGVSTDQNAKFGVFAASGGKSLQELLQGYKFSFQSDLSVTMYVDHLFFRRGGQRSGMGDLRNLQAEFAFQFSELGSHHEKDDQQKDDVDHRRHVECRLFVQMRFKWHNGILDCRSVVYAALLRLLGVLPSGFQASPAMTLTSSSPSESILMISRSTRLT